MTEHQNLILDQDGALLVIRLNRPAVLNALTDELMRDLFKAFIEARDDSSVRAIILTGEGRGFCAGADLAASALASPADRSVSLESPQGAGAGHVAEKLRRVFNPVVECMRQIPKPIVTAVNGIAAGAGMSLAMAGDIIICAESASFLQAFTKIGLIPDAGSTWFLPRLVGDAKARALVMMAERLPAQEAERIGLVYRVIPDAELEVESLKIGQFLASMPTRAYALMKQALNQSHGASLQEQLDFEASLQAQAAATEDCREGIAAFLEKRQAQFKGH